MKKSIRVFYQLSLITVICCLFFIFYFLQTQKNLITEGNQATQNLSEKLESTIAFMDQMVDAQKKQEDLLKPLDVGTKAPNFTLLNENNEKVSLKDYKGQNVTLVFSQKECIYCENFYPVVNDYAKKFKEETKTFIIQSNSSVADNKKLKIEEDLLPSILKTNGDEQLVDYKVFETPTTVIIDKEGNIQSVGSVSNLDEMTLLLKSS